MRSMGLLSCLLHEYGAIRTRVMYERMAHMPCFFSLFKLFFAVGFRSSIWSVEYGVIDNKGACYHIKRGLWSDTCARYDCPELCKLFAKAMVSPARGWRGSWSSDGLRCSEMAAIAAIFALSGVKFR